MTQAAAPVRAATEQEIGDPSVPRMELAEWRERYGLIAGITGRAGDFDLGLFTGAPASAVLGRWLSLERALAPGFEGIAISRQVHGTALATHQEPGGGLHLFDGFDGHLTCGAGLALAITVADCVPVYLAHPGSGAVALLHAGWRGVAAGVLETGIRDLTRLVNRDPRDIVMHCGIAICGECYEVGPEVIEQVGGQAAGGSERLDLRAILAQRAFRLGLTVVTISSWCSAHDRSLFYSHRRSRGSDGRMAAYLGRPLP